eukprot:scaffold63392_cov24-Tisochrysis_lutea.AAC.1
MANSIVNTTALEQKPREECSAKKTLSKPNNAATPAKAGSNTAKNGVKLGRHSLFQRGWGMWAPGLHNAGALLINACLTNCTKRCLFSGLPQTASPTINHPARDLYKAGAPLYTLAAYNNRIPPGTFPPEPSSAH